MKNIQIFEKLAKEYDEWFDENELVYKSEILALRKLIPKKGKGLEIGVGTGRFAAPLNIHIGVEPAKAMADIARKRGIEVYEARAEKLPFNNNSFDFILMVTTICFLQDPMQALREAKRVLKSEGHIIIGMIDANSPHGRMYKLKKKKSRFYKNANFYPVNQVLKWLKNLGFGGIQVYQTIFRNIEEINDIQEVKEGYGEGLFVVISAQKVSI
ncbi:SAM-dependent methyltransferase [Thermoplasmatales archaeon ex4484_30]|nr:MAG: SAM-dependent methyltransferase [Thermoplasmatales archaeon ex4484_30]